METKRMSIVALLSDFGTIDGYVGAMKGVVLTHAPLAQIIDVTHEIPRQDVRAGAWALRQSARYFPAGTIFCAVVDPGVGTSRAPLVLTSGGRFFIGPDNGLLSWAAQADSRVFAIERPELMAEQVSRTFHGRDIFASVAGHLAQGGLSPEACGPPVDTWVRLPFPRPERHEAKVRGEVLHIDHFGNVVTTIDTATLGDYSKARVQVGARDIGPIRATFGDVDEGDWLAFIGSAGLLEVAIRGGDAADDGNFGIGVPVVVSLS
ncbi:MAG: SAM-dependent chlorinase/fluorinase [Myxococcales bacterium]|nr:SAM-dependent chlorinase/fluorinase [Myxococcales bacterium]